MNSIVRRASWPAVGCKYIRQHAEQAIFIPLIFLLAFPYLIALRTRALGYLNDDGIYVVTAKALAEGRGYNIISLPQVVPQTKYPILFPLLLAGVWKLDPHFPQNVRLLRLVPFLWALAWFWLSYLLLRRVAGSGGIARWLVLFAAALPSIVFISVSVVSETMFAALMTAALLLLAKAESNSMDAGIRDAAFGGILAGAAFLTRTAGLPLLAAGAVSLIVRRKFLSATVYSSVWLALAAPWLAWQHIAFRSPPVEEAYYTLANYKEWNLVWNFTPAQKSVIILKNLQTLASAPGMLIDIGPRFLPLIGWLITAMAIWGWATDSRRWRSSLWLFVPFYCGLIVLWAFSPLRFVIPIVPIVLLYASRGLVDICHRSAVAFWKPGFACAAVMLLLLGNGLVRQATLSSHDGEEFLGSPPGEWHDMETLCAWVRENTSRNAVVLANLDSALYLYTDRKALRGYNANPYEMYYVQRPQDPLGKTADLAAAILRQSVDYAVIIGKPRPGNRESFYFNQWMLALEARYPGVVRRMNIGPSTVYNINRETLFRDLQERGAAPMPGRVPSPKGH